MDNGHKDDSVTTYGWDTEEKLYLEYVPDDFRSPCCIVRDFGVVAMFYRRRSWQAAYMDNEETCMGLALYLWIARKLQTSQKTPVRFFFVIGGQAPPWRMFELSIETGKTIGREWAIESTSKEDWERLWDEIGLTGLREAVRQQMTEEMEAIRAKRGEMSKRFSGKFGRSPQAPGPTLTRS